MINQLMNECQTLGPLAGLHDGWTVRLEIVHDLGERKFQASYGDKKSKADQSEAALQRLKLKLISMVEGKAKELQETMEKQNEQLRKMEMAINKVGGNNVPQISS